MSVIIHSALGEISEQLGHLNAEFISTYPDFIASGFFLPSSEQKGALVPVAHQGGSIEHRVRMDENVLYRRLTPDVSLAARAHQENRILFDQSIMFPQEHQCYCLPVGIEGQNRGMLQLVFGGQAKNRSVAVNSDHIARMRGIISPVPDMFSDFERAVFTTDFSPDYNIIIHIDVSDFRQLSLRNGYREAETFVSAFFTQELPSLLEVYNVKPLRMEGDGMRLMMPVSQVDLRQVLQDFVTSVTKRFSSYAANYKRGFDDAKLKVVCEVGEVLSKEIKVKQSRSVQDFSGPVDTKIKEIIRTAERKENAVIWGPQLRQLML